MTDPFKCDKTADDQEDRPSFDLRNPSHPVRVKACGLTSDEDTTSSSLVPIPNTLRQMRGQMKRVVSDGGEELTEVESSSISACIVAEDISNSLQELRRKYALKNETSVTMKMNSANLMLDDILNSKNISCGFQSKYLKGQPEIKRQKIVESDTSSLPAETVSTTKHCDHTGRIALPYEALRPRCQRHDKSYRPVCLCSNFYDKGLEIIKNENEGKGKQNMSFFEKLQNLHLKYRIQSVYKIVQKNNPFNKDRKECASVEQGIPSTNDTENVGCDRRKCDEKRCPGNRYPKRMVFDLVESSDACQSDERSSTGTCICENKCTCHDPKECTCPELLPECTCDENVLDFSKFIPEQTSSLNSERVGIRTTTKINEFSQTESKNYGDRETKAENSARGFTTNPVPFNSTVDTSPNNKTFNQISQPSKEYKNNLHNQVKAESKRCYMKSRKLVERTDIYYFDHGNSSYYRTTDNHPIRYTECLVERTDEYATKFWGEIFGFIEIGMAFLVSFILQLYR
ncbi:hypothetical protein RUM43_014285 [Polyplax serrata]|uniref:Uncharacterized protein n=1 Tax=Polyplax serrata TaxID=468196 RepID=A0AAN8RY14_POLSC